MTPEFNLIKRFFTRPTPQADLGVGDDAALVSVQDGHQLVISTDMSVADTHFFADAAPYFIGWKSLAVNVSDIASMGATPKWATLALALPSVDEAWLAEFSRGFFACADRFGVDLIGGDTTRGPLNICVTIMGEVPTNKALRRDGAKVGDEIWVSGQLGAAAFALAKLIDKNGTYNYIDTDELTYLLSALHTPQPRAALGLALREVAHSAIDISDGLLADLGHILTRSNVGAELALVQIPNAQLKYGDTHRSDLQKMALTGGDDYELCFTAAVHAHEKILQIGRQLELPLSCIGRVVDNAQLTLLDALGHVVTLSQLGLESDGVVKYGFDHFSA
jgi:thiamine-monophosphate kinase